MDRDTIDRLHRPQDNMYLVAALGISVFVNILFSYFVFTVSSINFTRQTSIRDSLYCIAIITSTVVFSAERSTAPAQNVLHRKDVVFDLSLEPWTTPFQGRPNKQNNRLWKDLYSYGVSSIHVDEARRLMNKTLPIPGDQDHYIISLSVFHQLHCLNAVRKGLYGDVDWTNQDEMKSIDHLDHCIDIIRQSLQCSADITPLTWKRDPKDGKASEIAEVIHTCRDWNSIRSWAVEHRMRVKWNATAIVEDDPLGWGTYGMEP